MYRNIEIHKAKDGNYNLKVDKRYIYSRYFPLEEAGKFIEANKELYLDKKVVVVYGVGLGYHVKELLKEYLIVQRFIYLI
ncbi:hypothetical protein [Clostridium tetanomorphum]|uniref:hypothetical protein n=1 Tax=Clostridium tetanomorphum TaxID=1553 RepID=UPI000D9A3372|nr:hypothetical protein [Clostridium tetanomorphum]SQC03124.1 Uncharacterized protein conserved in bacteria [Clostridium tetanomorphum]